MPPKFSQCLINEIADTSYRKTGIIFHEKYILAPGSILSNCINQHIAERLSKFELITITPDENVDLYRKKFRVIVKINQNLYETFAILRCIFNCKRLNEVIKKYFIGTESFTTCNSNNDQLSLSCFALFEFTKALPKIEFVTEKWSISSKPAAVAKLDEIYSVTIPFVNENLFHTINVGKISNILDENGFILIGSMSLAQNCEGGGIYNREHMLIGIILLTSFRWKNEIGQLTLIGNFNEIIDEFIEQSAGMLINKKYPSNLVHFHENSFAKKAEQSVVMIQINQSWGTGCLVKVDNWKMLLTCAHVVSSSAHSKIECIWKEGSFCSDIIYKSSQFNQPYDVAVLSVPLSIPDEYFANCTIDLPKIGQRIYSIGFPHFSTLATKSFSPSIYDGFITKIADGVFITDASIQAGQSGGPLFNESGQLIGISVSNSKCTADDTIYPHLNMAIPVFEIYPALKKYAKTKDVKSFKSLVANRQIKSIWSLETPKINSKL